MEHYCNIGDGDSILRVFREMRQSSGVHFDANSYALIIGALARFRFFCVDGTPIDRAGAAGFSSLHGPELLDEIASEMAEDILELSEEAATRLAEAFLEGFSSLGDDSIHLDDIPILSNEVASSNLLIGRVQVNDTTALCPASGTKLRLFALDETQRQHVYDTLLEMARSQHQEFTKKQRRKNDEDEDHGFVELSRFSQWLE
jgi:hypothetical protein